MTLGENIGKYRRDKGLTQKQLAEKINIAGGSMQNYELDKRKPDYKTLNKISEVLEISIDELVNGESSIYINRLNRSGIKIKRDVSELTTQELIEELNSRNDFPIKINIK